MDKSLLMFRGGVRSFKRRSVDGSELDLYYLARTPAESANFRGSIRTFPSDAAGSVAMDEFMAKFLVSAMCNEDGSALLTLDDAHGIPDTLKIELCTHIINGSGEVGDIKKG